jgi:hypothetical protein
MTTQITTANNKISNKRLLILFVLLLLSGAGVFGQEASAAKQEVVVTTVDQQSLKAEENAQMELVSWLTGARKSQLSNETSTKTSTNKTGRKQYINCGMTPNRILTRTLLKKAMAQDSSVA